MKDTRAKKDVSSSSGKSAVSSSRKLAGVKLRRCTRRNVPSLTERPFTSAAATRKLILATDSRFRRRGSRLKPERELEKEQREAAPGVTGVCGVLRPSAVSSAMRKARPRARGSMIFCMPSWHGPTYNGGGVSVLVSDTLSWLGRSSSRMTWGFSFP